MKQITLKFTGVRPLIMQSAAGMNLTTDTARKRYDLNARIKAARKKADNFAELLAFQQESMELDWHAGLYWHEGRFFVPSDNVAKSLEGGASTGKAKREIVAQCLIDEEIYVTGIPVYKTLAEYYDDQAFRLPGPIRVPPKTGARNWTCKPKLPTGWVIQFTVSHEDTVAAARILSAAVNAGASVGIGGWRPKFGRFTVVQV